MAIIRVDPLQVKGQQAIEKTTAGGPQGRFQPPRPALCPGKEESQQARGTPRKERPAEGAEAHARSIVAAILGGGHARSGQAQWIMTHRGSRTYPSKVGSMKSPGHPCYPGAHGLLGRAPDLRRERRRRLHAKTTGTPAAVKGPGTGLTTA